MEWLEEDWSEERRADRERERRISELAMRYRAGDLAVLSDLYDEFAPFIASKIRPYVTGPRRLPNCLDAEDLYQQAYVELAETALDWDPKQLDNFVPYALGALPWRIAHYLRSQAPARRTGRFQVQSTPHDLLMEAIARKPGPDGRDWDGDLACEEMLLKLPVHYRQVVRLHLFSGLSFAEVGKVTGMGRSASHEAFQRAIMFLRSMLE